MSGVVGVTLGFWQDRDPMEAVVTAGLVDSLGYRDLWIGEMATFDAFALATAIGIGSDNAPGSARGAADGPRGASLTIGPLAPAVRDPAMLAIGVASVAALTGRRVDLAIGTSSPTVVAAWHGRPFVASAAALARTVGALRPLLAGSKGAPGGYRLRLPAVDATITVAAFGPHAIGVAGRLADRMVINLCTPAQAAVLRAGLDRATESAGRGHVPLAAWIPAAVDPDDAAIEQLRRAIVPYLAAPGYAEMFVAAGFGEPVELARAGGHPAEVLARVPVELVEAVGIVGGAEVCRNRIEEHRAAGVDEIVIVPATAGDPGGERTLRALAPRPVS